MKVYVAELYSDYTDWGMEGIFDNEQAAMNALSLRKKLAWKRTHPQEWLGVGDFDGDRAYIARVREIEVRK